MDSEFQDRLRIMRILGGKVSQVELASLLGTSQALICFWETGRCRPQRKYLKLLNELFSLNPEALRLWKMLRGDPLRREVKKNIE